MRPLLILVSIGAIERNYKTLFLRCLYLATTFYPYLEPTPLTSAEPAHPTTALALRWMPAAVQESLALGRLSKPLMTAGTRDRGPAAPPETIDWTQVAHSLALCLALGLLFDAAHAALPTVIGDLVWVRQPGDREALPYEVHPMPLVPLAPRCSPRSASRLSRICTLLLPCLRTSPWCCRPQSWPPMWRIGCTPRR
jgi:hypothetical protein